MENSFSKYPTPVEGQDVSDLLLHTSFLFNITHKTGCKNSSMIPTLTYYARNQKGWSFGTYEENIKHM
jgi:hypothetical protein